MSNESLYCCSYSQNEATIMCCPGFCRPKHKSGRNKGFGFTTFESEEELERVLQVLVNPQLFNSIRSVLPVLHVNRVHTRVPATYMCKRDIPTCLGADARACRRGRPGEDQQGWPPP